MTRSKPKDIEMEGVLVLDITELSSGFSYFTSTEPEHLHLQDKNKHLKFYNPFHIHYQY